MPFVWCQGITPLRWTVAKLVLVGGAVGAAVVPIGVLFAFVLGALAGALLRRTVPAMVLTGAGYTAFLLFATSLNDQQTPGYRLWLLTEGNGLLVYTGLLVAVLLWHVHRSAGRTR